MRCTAPDTREGPGRHAPVHRAIQFSSPTVPVHVRTLTETSEPRLHATEFQKKKKDCTRPTRRWIKSATGTSKATLAVQPSHRRLQALKHQHHTAWRTMNIRKADATATPLA